MTKELIITRIINYIKNYTIEHLYRPDTIELTPNEYEELLVEIDTINFDYDADEEEGALVFIMGLKIVISGYSNIYKFLEERKINKGDTKCLN
jgi:hypothetical protein